MDLLHQLEDQISQFSDEMNNLTKCKMQENITQSMLSKSNRTISKDTLSEKLVRLMKLVCDSKSALRSAAGALDQLKVQQISTQKTVIELQKNSIENKGKQLGTIQETVKSEMRSYSDALKKNCGTIITPQKIRKVVKTYTDIEDRSSNVIVCGFAEDQKSIEGRNITDEKAFSIMCGRIKHPVDVRDCERIGDQEEDNSKPRPLKVKLSSRLEVQGLLSRTKNLKGSSDYSAVYVTPDRSKEERAAHRKLVEEMKQKIEAEPTKLHFIRDKKVCSITRDQSRTKNPDTVIYTDQDFELVQRGAAS